MRWSDREMEIPEEWVLYHSGTGGTLRLSDAALAILDVLMASEHPVSLPELRAALAEMLDGTEESAAIASALESLLQGLLSQECIEQVPCA